MHKLHSAGEKLDLMEAAVVAGAEPTTVSPGSHIDSISAIFILEAVNYP